jgi:hypothetical protein
MKRMLLLFVLLLNIVTAGCNTRADIQASRSAFLSQFSLQKTLANLNAPGLDCSGASGDSSAVGAVGSSGVSNRRSESRFCGIERADEFEAAGFIQRLKAEIERQIQATGGQVQGSSPSGSTGFHIEYVLGKSQGKIEISGESQSSAYMVTTKIEEKI